MLTIDHVLMELNQQRRAQIAEGSAAVRAAKDRRRAQISLFRRRTCSAPSSQDVTTAIRAGAVPTTR